MNTDFRQDEEVGLQLRRLAAMAGLRPSTVLRLLVQNAPPAEDLCALAKPTKNNRTAEPLAGQRSAVVTPIS